MQTVRPPAVAGTFYPGDRAALESMIAGLLSEARAELPAEDERGPVPKALISPHAGYIYSGPTAARGYVRLDPARETIHRVVLLGPVHHVPIRGLALPGARFLRTPLGDVPVEVPDVLGTLRQVDTDVEAHRWEHSLEVQLPFLQTVLAEFAVVPLVVGQASPESVAEVIEALWGGPETLVVVSSDLSHYLRYATANGIDTATVDRILSLEGPLESRQACGASPANGLLTLAPRRTLRPVLYDRRTSGDTAGDKDRVVGYASIGFHEPITGARAGTEPGSGDGAA
ncbi:AmmeMemoRadiSam system protein B [Raineyella fluvialis]|uniref:MEMO1 family protein Rai3103_06885 n=1 Tax=Raineyella fluvialis TaxID=2662261 RepID=A0A5Q2FGK5_9ACTN|nr:AmmeMemoRadiSam system protein B [Raineyella fluvialis]QGF23436.1 AmmeMemoRadiSam system protein B [Raineyella fluvialis]